MLKKTGFVLVLLMALLQGFYGVFAYIDPVAFANLRGTELVSVADADWIQIYGSRTVFIALLIGFLLYTKSYKILIAASVFGIVMPATDGWLAYQAGADSSVIIKHLVTVVYLAITAYILSKIVNAEGKTKE